MLTTEERLAALEAAVAQVRNKLGMDSQLPTPTPPATPGLRGWEELPASFVVVGFSRDLYALRPERFAGEPAADRMVPRGNRAPTEYLYDEASPAWVNYQRWQQAGAPTTDKLGRPLDVRGYPLVGEQKWSPGS